MSFDALINRGSSVSLDAPGTDNGTWLQQWDYNATSNQLWQFEDAGDGWFMVKDQQSGRVLDVPTGDVSQDGTRVQLWDGNWGDHQKWQKVDVGSGWFWLKNRASGKALDVHANDIAKNGAKVQQWSYNGTTNQQWRQGGNTGSDRFVFGPFDFDPDHSAEQICTLFERHRFAFSRIAACGNLNDNERQSLSQAYQRAIRHSVTTDAGINGRSIVNGSQIWINFGILFPQGANEIAQTLIHEMMHCAGFTHPDRRDPPAGMSCATPNPALFDCPYDNGQYYGTPPLRAELCIAGTQSDVLLALTDKAKNESCSESNGVFTIRVR